MCVCAFMHVRDHIYTISEWLPRRRTIRQADRFVRREPGGCRAAAGAKPTEIARSVCKSAQLVTGLGIGSTSSPVHLTSVTFGCSTKDSGLILGMSMWIWQQHGRECVKHTRTHTHKHKHTQYKSPPHVLHFKLIICSDFFRCYKEMTKDIKWSYYTHTHFYIIC